MSSSRKLPFRPRFLATLMMCTALITPFSAHASADTERIAKFFNAAGLGRASMQQQILQIRKDRPAIADVVEKSLGYFNSDEYIHLFGTVLEGQMSQSEIQYFLQFMATPTGIRIAKIFRDNPDLSSMGAEAEKMPKLDQDNAVTFFNSSPVKHTITIMGSPEMHKAASEYGEKLTCSYYADTNVDIFKKLQGLGRCKASVASSAQ